VPGPDEFLFSMKVAGRDAHDGVLDDVAATVFRHVGCGSAAVADLVKQLHGVVIPGADEGKGFDVQFRAHAGVCEVIVFTSGRELWRLARPMSSESPTS
jgi:hypothetical protein